MQDGGLTDEDLKQFGPDQEAINTFMASANDVLEDMLRTKDIKPIDHPTAKGKKLLMVSHKQMIIALTTAMGMGYTTKGIEYFMNNQPGKNYLE